VGFGGMVGEADLHPLSAAEHCAISFNTTQGLRRQNECLLEMPDAEHFREILDNNPMCCAVACRGQCKRGARQNCFLCETLDTIVIQPHMRGEYAYSLFFTSPGQPPASIPSRPSGLSKGCPFPASKSALFSSRI